MCFFPPSLIFSQMEYEMVLFQCHIELMQSRHIISSNRNAISIYKQKEQLQQQINWQLLAGNGTNSIPWVFCNIVVQHAFPDWLQGGRMEAAPSHGHRVPSSSAYGTPHCQTLLHVHDPKFPQLVLQTAQCRNCSFDFSLGCFIFMYKEYQESHD